MEQQQNHNGNGSIVKYGQWVVKYRWPVLLLTIIIAMALGYGGQKLGFNSDYRVFFSEENPQLNAFDALQKNTPRMTISLSCLNPKTGMYFQTAHWPLSNI